MSVLSSASIIDAMARLSPKDATALASLAERVAMGYIISQSHFVQCVKRELGSADLVFRALLLLRGEQSAPNAIPDSQALVLHTRASGERQRAAQRLKERRLARAVGPTQDGPLPSTQLQIDVCQDHGRAHGVGPTARASRRSLRR